MPRPPPARLTALPREELAQDMRPRAPTAKRMRSRGPLGHVTTDVHDADAADDQRDCRKEAIRIS